MKVLLGAVFLIMMLLTCISIYRTGEIEGRLAKTVTSFLRMMLLLLGVNAFLVISTSYFLSTVALNAYYACIDWTLICLLHFMEEYTQTFRENQRAKSIIYGAALADTLVMA